MARGLKSRSWQGHAPSEVSREESFLTSSGFRWLLVVLDVPWLLAAVFQSLLPLSHGLLRPINTVIGLRAHPPQYDFTLVTSAKALSQNKVTSTGTRVMISTYFGGEGWTIFNMQLYLKIRNPFLACGPYTTNSRVDLAHGCIC